MSATPRCRAAHVDSIAGGAGLPPTVAVLAAEPGTAAGRAAVELARELHLPFTESGSTGIFDLLLACTSERVELRDNRDLRAKPVAVDFSKLVLRPYSPNLSRRQPLARAIGRRAQTVIDATAGFGRDAFLLAHMNYVVIAIERSAVVYALLRDALRRAPDVDRVTGRFTLVLGDARVVLPALSVRPDVIYLDPMFPPKRKPSAAARKEVRLLRALAGDDRDAGELFTVARRLARQRVVVKRPDHAPPLFPNPTASFAGKLVRYDMYAV